MIARALLRQRVLDACNHISQFELAKRRLERWLDSGQDYAEFIQDLELVEAQQ